MWNLLYDQERVMGSCQMDVVKETFIRNTMETHWVGNDSWLVMWRVKPQTVSLLCWTLWMGLVTVMVSLASERSWSYSASQSSRSGHGVFRAVTRHSPWPSKNYLGLWDHNSKNPPWLHDLCGIQSYTVSPTIPHKYTVLYPPCHGATVHFFADENPLDQRTKQATMLS